MSIRRGLGARSSCRRRRWFRGTCPYAWSRSTRREVWARDHAAGPPKVQWRPSTVCHDPNSAGTSRPPRRTLQGRTLDLRSSGSERHLPADPDSQPSPTEELCQTRPRSGAPCHLLAVIPCVGAPHPGCARRRRYGGRPTHPAFSAPALHERRTRGRDPRRGSASDQVRARGSSDAGRLSVARSPTRFPWVSLSHRPGVQRAARWASAPSHRVL